MGLARPEAPKMIARLPFVERPDHPAGMPVFVIAKPLADGAAARDVVLEAVTLDRWRGGYPAGDRGARAARSSATPPRASGCRCWSRGRADSSEGAAAAALRKAGAVDARSVEIGAHAARYDGSKLRPRGG